jgi:tetratricopeptide (TPR) repeat protein
MQVAMMSQGGLWRRLATPLYCLTPPSRWQRIANTLKPLRHLALLGAILMVLTACEGLPSRTAEPPLQTTPAPAPELPFKAPENEVKALAPDLLYSYLVGEVAAQRGDLRVSYRNYMRATELGHDPYAAERATRIAVYLGDLPAALRAAQQWVALAPNSQDARMSLGLLREHGGDRAGALTELEALLKISAALGQDGFVQIARVLAKEGAAQLRDLMTDLVAAHPDAAHAHYALGYVDTAAKDYESAEQQLTTALTQQPDWIDAEILLARVRHARGDIQVALDGLSKAVQRQPDNQVLRTAYARLLVDAGKHEQALKQFQRLQRQAPDNTDYLYAVGMLAIHGEHWEEARKVWQALRSRGGEHRNEATYYLAHVEEHDGKLKVAAGLYASISEGPLLMDAGLRLASIEAKQGKLPQARARLQHLRLLVPGRAADAYLAEARLLRQADKTAEARQLLDDAVAAHPDNIDLRYGRAMQAAKEDDIETLEQDLQHVLALDPNHADALNALGYTLADRTNRYAEAYEYINRAYRLQPESPAILDSMGWVSYRLGHYAEAIRFLRKALALLPDPEIAAHLGEVLWVTGKRDAARAVWHKALKHSPDSPELHAVMQRFE